MAKAKIKSTFQYNFSKTFKILVVFLLIGAFPLIAKGAQEEELCEVKLSDIEGEYAPGEVLVKFKHGIREEKQKEVCRALGVSMRKKIPSIDVHLLGIPAEKKVSEMIGLFRKHPFIEYAEPNYRRYKTVTIPNDTYFSSQWALSQTSDHDIDAPEAWDITTGDSSVIIAIIDDGIDYLHEEFASPKLWINPATGKPGYDFGGSDRVQGVYVPDDDVMHESGSGHGTATSGIAAGLTNNAKGIAGTSWLPTIMPLKVENGFHYIYDSYIANAITFAVDNGAHILSMSLGGSSPSSTLENACQYAWENGKVIVVSSGNENTSISYPARFLTTIAVGATNEIDNRIYVGNPGNNWSSGGSNYGPELDVVAPGINIYSPDWSESGEGYDPNASYIPNFGGTSASCPFVSGECALLLSKDPELPNQRVRSIIRSSAQDQVGEPSQDTPGFDIYYGYGRINLYNALSGPTKPDLTLSSSAGDIGFSNETPLPGETINISATIHNNGSMYDEVNPTPFASVLTNTGSGFYVDSRFSVAQSFTATTNGWLGEVALAMRDLGTNSSYARIEIQTNSGSNTPSGIVVSSTETQDWPADYITWERIEFSNPAKLTAGTKYWIVVTCSDSYQNGYLWRFNNGSVYAGGGKSGKDNTASPPTWAPESTTNDCQFKVYLSIYNTIVEFYDGDPSAGGTQIDGNQSLPPIPSSGTGTASVEWTVTSGTHNIWVVVDPTNSIPESDETNNKDYKTITAGTVLSILVSPTSWSMGPVEPGSITTMTIANNILVQNNGNVNETFTLQVTNTGGTWNAATTENGNTDNTFVMSGLFTAIIDSIVANDFNEGTHDDVIISTNSKSATSTTFGCSKSTLENGVGVPPSGGRYLWLQFKAPSSSSVTTQQTIIVTVGAEQTP